MCDDGIWSLEADAEAEAAVKAEAEAEAVAEAVVSFVAGGLSIAHGSHYVGRPWGAMLSLL